MASGNTVYDSRDNCNAIIETSTNLLVSGCKNTVIPNSVTTIGNSAFSSCSGLTSIEIPNSVTSIGSDAFSFCSGLTSIEIPNSVTSIGSYAFYYCRGLTSIEIPNSVTSIGDEAFYRCSGLTSIVISNSLIELGFCVFFYCSNLVSITVLAEYPLGEYGAFEGVNKSIPVYVPCGSVEAYTAANWGGFNNFIGLCGGEITVAANPTEGGMVTGGGSYESDTICTLIAMATPGFSFINWIKDGRGISNSETYSFYVAGDACCVANFVQEGATITFADANVKALCVANWDTDGDGELSYVEAAAVTNLGTVFRYNWNITNFDELQYFVGLTSIGNEAFFGCSGLTSIEIPNSVIIIGDYAFADCSGLTSIEIPNSVTFIGEDAFSYCSGLTTIEISNSVTSISYDAFYNCSSLEQIIVDSGNTVYDSRDNCNAIVETSTNALLFGCKNTVIPNSVTSVGNYAFYSCSGLTSIEIPNSVTSIGNSAFSSCSGLTSVEISNSVISLGSSVFRNCSSLKQMIVDSGNSVYDSRENCNAIIKTNTNELVFGCKNTIIPNSVTSIGRDAFSHCSGLTFIKIPNSVTSIGNSAFYSCKDLTSIEIPNSVTSISSSAFSWCNGLTSMIVFAGNPPTTANDAFYKVNKLIPVYMPCGSVETYTAANWAGFNNFIGFCGGTVALSANPEEGGEVTGGGVFGADETCTVTATSNDGYAFGIWTRDGMRVSTNAEYTFYVSGDMDLVALFVPNANITFADANVKSVCVSQWDTNSDGELSYAEAAAVASLGEVFRNNTSILSFEELQYFVGLTSIGGYAFSGCSGLTSIEIPNSVTLIGDYAF